MRRARWTTGRSAVAIGSVASSPVACGGAIDSLKKNTRRHGCTRCGVAVVFDNIHDLPHLEPLVATLFCGSTACSAAGVAHSGAHCQRRLGDGQGQIGFAQLEPGTGVRQRLAGFEVKVVATARPWSTPASPAASIFSTSSLALTRSVGTTFRRPSIAGGIQVAQGGQYFLQATCVSIC